MNPVLQMMKLKNRNIKDLAQDYKLINVGDMTGVQ